MGRADCSISSSSWDWVEGEGPACSLESWPVRPLRSSANNSGIWPKKRKSRVGGRMIGNHVLKIVFPIFSQSIQPFLPKL